MFSLLLHPSILLFMRVCTPYPLFLLFLMSGPEHPCLGQGWDTCLGRPAWLVSSVSFPFDALNSVTAGISPVITGLSNSAGPSQIVLEDDELMFLA